MVMGSGSITKHPNQRSGQVKNVLFACEIYGMVTFTHFPRRARAPTTVGALHYCRGYFPQTSSFTLAKEGGIKESKRYTLSISCNLRLHYSHMPMQVCPSLHRRYTRQRR